MDALPTTPTEWADQAQRNGFVPLSSWKVIKSGSNWTYNELLTFRVLHKNKGQEHPEFLKAYIPEAQEIISNEPRFQKAFSLFDGAEFRKMSYLMLRKHNEFGSFFKILTGLVVDDEKTEKLKLAKFLIWDFLDSVWQCTSDHYSHDRASQFEWSMTSDCLTFKVPNGKYVKTSNDANLIRKLPGRLRHWEREYAQLCYCSIESNATYKTDDEQVQGFAQTTSRILSMIYQRKNHDGKEIFRPDSKAIIPLVSITRKVVRVIFATYTAGYDDFLISGDSSEDQFLEMNQFGPFLLDVKSDFIAFSALMFAFKQYLDDNTEEHGGNEDYEVVEEDDSKEDESPECQDGTEPSHGGVDMFFDSLFQSD